MSSGPVVLMIEFKRSIQFFYDFYLQNFDEEVIVLPAVFETDNKEVDLVVGESSANILGLRFYENAPDCDNEQLPEEINLLDEIGVYCEQIQEEEIEDIEEDQQEEDDVVWDFCLIQDDEIKANVLFSFIYDLNDNEDNTDDDENIDGKEEFSIPDDVKNEIMDSEPEEIILNHPCIKVDILSSNGQPVGAKIYKYDKKQGKPTDFLGFYLLEPELFRRQIQF